MDRNNRFDNLSRHNIWHKMYLFLTKYWPTTSMYLPVHVSLCYSPIQVNVRKQILNVPSGLYRAVIAHCQGGCETAMTQLELESGQFFAVADLCLVLLVAGMAPVRSKSWRSIRSKEK